MKTNIVIDISPPIPYLEKFWFLRYRPKCLRPIKLQVKSNQIKIEVNDEVYFWRGKYLKYLQKQVRDEVDFLHGDKLQSFLQVYFKTLDNKVSYRLIRSLLMGMIKHSQSTQINKFAISLQYFKKEVRVEFIFCI